MSWAAGWSDSLRGPARLRLVVGGLGLPPVLELGPDELLSADVSGGELALRQWATTTPQLTVRVAGGPLRLAEVRACRLGLAARLYVETTAGEEVVWTGPLCEVQTPRPGVVALVVDDASAWARSRYGVPGAGLMAWRDGLFASSLLTTTNTSSYHVPAGTMAIAGDPTDCFAEDPGGGRWALVEVEGPDGLYYLSASGYTASSLSGLTLEWIPAGSGTPATPTGATVRVGPLFVGSPQDIVLRVLLSTGSAGGGYDILDADQGLALPPAVVDTADAARLGTVVGAVGYTDRWTFAALVQHADPEGGQLLAWAASLGVWLCPRQGSLTVRAACDPHDAAAWAALYAGAVTDDDIIELGTHSSRAPDMVPEYLGGRARSVTSGAAESEPLLYDPALGLSASRTPQTWPVGPSTYDLGWPGGGDGLPLMAMAYRDGTPAWSAHIDDTARRLCPWLSRQCEAVEVTLAGPALGWAAGDLVSVTSAAIPGPAATGGVAVGRRALWVPQAWDWAARTVSGTLYLLSAS